jgi:hypothetical protein
MSRTVVNAYFITNGSLTQTMETRQAGLNCESSEIIIRLNPCLSLPRWTRRTNASRWPIKAAIVLGREQVKARPHQDSNNRRVS